MKSDLYPDRHYIIPVFIPHKGCPFDCIYCNQKIISGQIKDVGEAEARASIDTCLSTIPKGSRAEIAFYGGSFTGIPKEQQIEFLKVANEYIDKGFVNSIRLSTRPDYIDSGILGYLSEYKVGTIELGVQSLDEDVLKASCRGHSVNDVITASRHIKEYGFELGIQTMVGLPGDTKEKDIGTAKKVVDISPSIVRIYPTLVIKETYLEKMYRSGQYKPFTLEETIDICAELVELYESNNIKVIRTGLQATENISENADVVAGPYHPAFGQLVESRIALRKIEALIEEKDYKDSESIIIITGKRRISDIVGQKRFNLEYLRKKYGFKAIKVAGQENLDRDIILGKDSK
ncbi:MAG: radical SAM protein [Bacillota bacterium]|nr:radical SAM protein [Bacillota bacterium]